MFRNSFVVLFVTAAVPLIAAGGWFASQAAAFRQVSLQLHREVAGQAATTVARHLDVLAGRLEFLRQYYPELANGEPGPAVADRVQRALRLNPDFLGMALVDRRGRELRRWVNSPFMRNFGELYRAAQPALQRAAELRRPASALAALAQVPALVSVQPVSADRYVCVAVSLEGLWNELARHRLGAGGMTVLAMADGRLLPVPQASLPRVEVGALKKLLQSGDRGWSDHIPAPEGAYVGMFERVASQGLADWYAVTLEPAAQAGLANGRLALILGAFALLAAALAAAGAVLLAAPLSDALRDTRMAAEALGRGELPAAPSFAGPGELRAVCELLGRTAEQMREREARLEGGIALERAKSETIIQHLPDAIVMTNLRGEVVYINAPAMATLGVRPEEMAKTKKGLFDLIHQDQLRMSVQQLLEKRTRSEVVEVALEGPDGPRNRFYQTTVTLLSSPEIKDMGVLLLMRDVSAERELAQMKEEFFHSVAHDLRAPIFAIQGYLRLLEKGMFPEPRFKVHFDSIHQSCEKLTLLIQDILDSARIESGQLKLGVAALEPAPLLQRVQRVYGALAAEKGIGLDLRLAPDLPPNFDADERLLERVFGNLVSNALKVVGKGGRITLAAERGGVDQIDFSVADTGPGIPKDKLGFIFEKFTQLGTGNRGGFGMGLNICRKIVELHRGKIWAESEEGVSSQFIFRIPIRQMV